MGGVYTEAANVLRFHYLAHHRGYWCVPTHFMSQREPAVKKTVFQLFYHHFQNLTMALRSPQKELLHSSLQPAASSSLVGSDKAQFHTTTPYKPERLIAYIIPSPRALAVRSTAPPPNRFSRQTRRLRLILALPLKRYFVYDRVSHPRPSPMCRRKQRSPAIHGTPNAAISSYPPTGSCMIPTLTNLPVSSLHPSLPVVCLLCPDFPLKTTQQRNTGFTWRSASSGGGRSTRSTLPGWQGRTYT